MPPPRKTMGSKEAMRAIAREQIDRFANRELFEEMTLEQLLTDPKLAAFQPSAVQLALVRAIDGQEIGDLLTPEQRLFHFGTLADWAERVRTVVLRTGVRAGKSLVSAMALLLSILTCQFRRLPLVGEVADADGKVGVRKGELVRALIVAPLLKLSRAPFDHLVGTMQQSPILSRLLVKHGMESCVIRRPDGAEVTVELVAASSGGANLRSTWLAGVIFDEADFHDDEDGAVNLPDNYRAAATRMLAGAQIWIPSSPWADTGPFHEMFLAAFGKGGRALAFHSDTRSMNPTLSREDEAAERARDPDNAAREYDAVPLSANSSQFFPHDAIEKAVSKDPARAMRLMPIASVRHYAGTDLGFRKNSSALAIARFEGKVRLAYYEEVRPDKGASLKPSVVCHGFADRCVEYGAPVMRGDQWYADMAYEELGKRGADRGRVAYDEWVVTSDTKTEIFTEFRRRMQEGLLDLPNDPRLIQQLKGVTSKPMPGGKVNIQLPKQGAAHADLLMAIVIACSQVPVGTGPAIRAPGKPKYTYRFPGNERGFG